MAKWIVVMKSNPAFALMIEEIHEKTSVRLVGTGIWTRDLSNESLVRYHGATSLSNIYYCEIAFTSCYSIAGEPGFDSRSGQFSLLKFAGVFLICKTNVGKT